MKDLQIGERQSAFDVIERNKLHKVIRKIMEHINEISIISAIDLAKEIDMTSASFTRFFKRNGFSGYNEFKQSLLLELGLSNIEKDVVLAENSQVFLNTFSNNLSSLYNLNSKETFEKVANAIVNSKSIVVVASGGTYAFAIELEQKLTELGFDSWAIKGPMPIDLNARLVNLTGSCLILLTYSGEHEAVEAIEKIRSMNNIVISITSSKDSVAYKHSNISLLINEDSKHNNIVLYRNLDFVMLNYLICQKIYELDKNRFSHKLSLNKL